MNRLALILVFSFVALQLVTAQTIAEDNINLLKQRVQKLEIENETLRNQNQRLKLSANPSNGVIKKVLINNRVVATLVISRDGWGESRPEDVAAVCSSCASTIYNAIPSEIGEEPTVLVFWHANKGPITLFERGPNNEFYVLLNSSDRKWAQLAYQFSHELGHVLCGALTPKKPQRWFEESFCEALSLWTLDRMGKTWKTSAPYSNWNSYSTSLTKYANDVRNRVETQSSINNWYKANQAYLTKQRYDRNKNLVMANMIAQRAHENEKFLGAFYYLRRKSARPYVDSMEWLLSNWHSSCPAEYKETPKRIAKTLGISISN